MVELGPLLAAWPQKAQFDRAARAMGRAGQGAALWELTELHMEVLSRETATRSELAAAEAEVARLTAEVAQLRAAAPPPPQQPAAPAPPCTCLCSAAWCRAAAAERAGPLPGDDGAGGAQAATGRAADLAASPASWMGGGGHWGHKGRAGGESGGGNPQGAVVCVCVVVVGRELRCGRELALTAVTVCSLPCCCLCRPPSPTWGSSSRSSSSSKLTSPSLTPTQGCTGLRRRRTGAGARSSARRQCGSCSRVSLSFAGFSPWSPVFFCATSLPFVQRLLARAETPKKTDPLVRVVWHANAVVLTKKSELAGALPVGAVRRAADGRVIAHLYEVQASFERAVLQLAQNGSPPEGLKGYAKMRCVCFCCGAHLRRDRDRDRDRGRARPRR